MINLTNNTVATISDCDEEPIHIPGSIQPHGYLIGVNPANGRICYGSENLEKLFSLPLQHILGQSIKDFFPQESSEIETYFQEKSSFQNKRFLVTHSYQTFQLIAHQSGNVRILEIEPIADILPETYSIQLTDLLSLIQSPGNLTELCQTVANYVRQTLGFDRSMIYRFDQEDFTGEVLAESRLETLESFLGLRYPASDIPPQARELYLKNPLRAIDDTAYEPVAIYGLPAAWDDAPAQLDLSHAQLRSVSPIHVQYLKNMGVGASFSISIIKDHRLWGLIACHHSSAKHLTLKQRDSAQLLGFLLSSQIDLHERNQAVREVEIVDKSLNHLIPFFTQEAIRVRDIITNPELLRIAQAQGVAILIDGQIFTNGNVPATESIKELTNFLLEHTGYEPFFSKNIATLFPPAEAYAHLASGIMYQPLGYLSEDCILWFRPGLSQTITWAGRPTAADQLLEARQKLSPRKSFEAWQEVVKNTSSAWAAVHVEATTYFASVFQKQLRLLHLQQDADKQRALNERMQAATEELENIHWISMHDLKEPLRKIQVLASRVLSQETQTLTDTLVDSINRMQNSAQRMQKLLDDISAYSYISTGHEPSSVINSNSLLSEIIQEKQEEFTAAGATIHMDNLPGINGIPFQIRQLFLNLLTNSFKFRKPDTDLHVAIWASEPSEEVAKELGAIEGSYYSIFIQDNGIGFEKDYRDIIFRLFKRLNTETSGTGIGLAICRKVMMNHQGYIWVNSEPNEGSQFELIFPLSRIIDFGSTPLHSTHGTQKDPDY
ncbi:ATP-binding protein [Arundinibacter roseus]|uniref:histidine kinase n=1 Tax=Arundinibacter roseus TaxID=2070510 RepID=A0A4R4K1T8_9BACT|nr:ATP-binding protein [Arundinibacter roseus]TDB61153.1 GAF domain-containing protein [Arundinibacter roseus]